MKSLKNLLGLVVLASITILTTNGIALAQENRRDNRNARDQNKTEKPRPDNRTQDRDQSKDNSSRPTADNNRGRNGQRDRTQDRNQNRTEPNRQTPRPTNRGQDQQRNRDQQDQTTRPRTTNRDDNRGRERQTQNNRNPVRPRPGYDDRGRSREIYRRPPPTYIPTPRYGRDHTYRYYPRYYRRSVFIIFTRIPLIIYQHPIYRNCRYESKVITNLDDYPAQILINGWPYPLDNGGDILYPGESARIHVPVGVAVDIEATVLIDGIWIRVDVESGNGSDIIIP